VKLLYIFPRTTSDPSERLAEHARRVEILQAAAGVGTTVDLRELQNCPPAVESVRDVYTVAPAIVAMAQQLQHEYDGMIVGCFSDPGVEGAIEATTHIPIIGCARPAISAALLLGQRFSILSPSPSSAVRARSLVMASGLLDRYAGAFPLNIGVREFASHAERALEVATEVGRRALESGADVLLLGCLSLAFTNVGDTLQKRLGLPIVNPIRIAVRTCEMLVSAGLAPGRQLAAVPRQSTAANTS
jgi:allantoin racemase